MSTEALGLSIGATNLVAARVGRPPVMRRAVLTLFADRAPEVGVAAENPALNQPGVVLTGFVERVGDPVPLVAEDGSSHRGERVLVEALDAMADTVGGGQPVAIAVPAHWGPATIGALRGALRDKPKLSPGGVPAALIPDSLAALTALQAAPGLPAGVIALVDLGGSGTSITLADANTNLAPIGETVRYGEFSGDEIDQAVLNHVLAGVADANNADPAGTAAVGSLTRLRDESRQAKERLSAETATVVPVDLPGFRSDVRLTRTELDNLIAGPLSGLLAAIQETLQRNNIAPQQPRRRGNSRWWRGHPAGHPTTVRTVPRAGHHHAAVATECRGGRGAAGRPGSGRRRADRTVGRRRCPDGYRARGVGRGCRRSRGERVGRRRRPFGHVPRVGLVAGRRCRQRTRAIHRRGLQRRRVLGAHRCPAAGGIHSRRRTALR